MNEQELLDEFSAILADLLLEDEIRLQPDTRRKDIDGWDSFNYVNFIVAVEVRYGIKFRVADVESFQNIGDIIAETQRLTKS